MNRSALLASFAVILFLQPGLATPSHADDPKFQTLFDGSTLDGWKHGGNWDVQDGVITRTGKGGSLVYTAA